MSEMGEAIYRQQWLRYKEALENLTRKVSDFRQDELKVIWDEIERGVHKEPMAVLLEVIRVFDLYVEPAMPNSIIEASNSSKPTNEVNQP